MITTQRTRRLLTAALTLVFTVVGLVAVPYGLIRYVGWPFPATVPALDEIRLALRSGIDPQLVVNTLALLVWITWLQLAVALSAETIAVIRGRAAHRLPVLPGIQHTAARIVATITLLLATLGPIRQPALAVATPLHAVVTTPEGLAAAGSLPVPEVSAGTSGVDVTRTTPAYPLYTVKRLDTLWSIAEHALGDGLRWSDIRNLNTGRTMTDGTPFTATTNHLTPGWVLHLPLDAALPDTPTLTDVTVERGDHFWAIAKEALTEAWGRPPTTAETADYWRRLIDTNHERLLPPHDPNLIHPGQVLELPPIPPDLQGAGVAAGGAGSDEVTVQRGDSFWSIAEHTLETDWTRDVTADEITGYWSSLIELNRHRLLAPHDPNLIFPGQHFQLPTIPADPNGHRPGSTNGPQPHSPEATDARSETPETTLPDRLKGPEPDEVLSVPDTSTPEQRHPATVADDPATSTDRNPGDPRGVDADDLVDEDPNGSGLLPTFGKLAGLGLLAAGVVAFLNRLRQTQIRLRRPGTIPTPPPDTTAPVEAMLRTAAAPTALETVDLALRSLGSHITDGTLTEPDLVAVQIAPDGVRLLLYTPHTDPPPTWHTEDNGRTWLLPTDTDVEALRRRAERTAAPWPALVTVGHHHDTQLLLNLEHPGALHITGDPKDVLDTLTTMAIELAASPLADTMNIYCIGFGHDLTHIERIHPVDKLTDVMHQVEPVLAAVGNLTDTTPVQGRLRPGGDTWEPIIVLDPTTNPSDAATRLLVAAHTTTPISAIVGYPTGQRWHLHIQGESAHLEPIGITLDRRNLNTDEQTAVAQLTATAKDLNGIPEPAPTTPNGKPKRTEGNQTPPETADHVDVPAPHADLDLAALADQPPTDREPSPNGASTPPDPEESTPKKPREPSAEGKSNQLEAKVLGNVRIDGLTEPFPRSRCRDVVVYLALHRAGADPDTLTEAIWPDQPPLPRRIIRYLSDARRTLGSTPTGEPFLPPISQDGLYRIHHHLGTDLDRLEQELNAARSVTEPDEQAAHLRAALQLVEGAPFSGGADGYTWAHTEGYVSHAIVTIDNAAHQLAEHALRNDDPDTATWAARKGLLATRSCEQCYRNLMRAGIADNNPTAVEAAYNQLVAITEADEGPDATDRLDLQTVDLYEQHRQSGKHHL